MSKLAVLAAVFLAACNVPAPRTGAPASSAAAVRPAPAAAAPVAAPLPALAGPAAVPAPPPPPAMAAPAAGPAEASDGERLAAGQAVQRLLAARHGPLSIASINLVSGVFRVVAQPERPGAQPIEIYITRDLQLVFPSAEPLKGPPPVAHAAAEGAAAEGAVDGFVECLKSKQLRLFGDANQPQTQRQLAELGPQGGQLLVDCAKAPSECKVLGQTSLPVLQLGAQRVSSHMPRAVIAKWAGCPLPDAVPAP